MPLNTVTLWQSTMNGSLYLQQSMQTLRIMHRHWEQCNSIYSVSCMLSLSFILFLSRILCFQHAQHTFQVGALDSNPQYSPLLYVLPYTACVSVQFCFYVNAISIGDSVTFSITIFIPPFRKISNNLITVSSLFWLINPLTWYFSEAEYHCRLGIFISALMMWSTCWQIAGVKWTCSPGSAVSLLI